MSYGFARGYLKTAGKDYPYRFHGEAQKLDKTPCIYEAGFLERAPLETKYRNGPVPADNEPTDAVIGLGGGVKGGNQKQVWELYARILECNFFLTSP